MIKKVKGPRSGFNPKTASTSAMKAKPPVRATGSNAFPDGQKQVTQPPAPFANAKGTVHLPTTSQFESRGTDTAKGPIAKGTSIGVRALPSGGPVGQKKPINHSGNVFGRMGTSHPRKAGSQNIGKAKRNANFYGE